MLYFLDGRFGGGSRLVAVLHFAHQSVLVLSDSVLSCFRLFLCGEFHHMVHGYLTLDRLAHLYLVLVIVVLITSFDNHYYQEDNIEVGSPLKCNVVVNHHVELSEEEKKAAREAAIKKLQEEELAKLKKRQQAKRENNTEVQTQLTLF